MTNTPETDARSAWLIGHAVVPEWLSRGGEQECVDADFARRLERELDEAREDVALCRDAIAHALDLVAEWEKDHDDDNASASARATRRRLNEALGKAEPRLLYEKPEGQQLFALAWKELRCERDALREALRALVRIEDGPGGLAQLDAYNAAIDRARAILGRAGGE